MQELLCLLLGGEGAEVVDVGHLRRQLDNLLPRNIPVTHQLQN